MEIQSTKSISNVNRPRPFSTILQTGLGIVRWLFGFFSLTEEDRLVAGIYVGSEGGDG